MTDDAVGLGSENLLDRQAADGLRGEAEPFGVAAVGVEVMVPRIHMGDQRRNGVHDEPQATFRQAQGLGNLVDLLVGAGQRGGAFSDPRLEHRVVLLDQALIAPLLRDVGPQGHESQIGNRHAANRQNLAIGPRPLRVVGLKGADGSHAFRHQAIDLALAVFAALGVVADEIFEGGAHPDHGLGKIQQAGEGLVPGDELRRRIEYRYALVQQVQTRQQQIVSAQSFGTGRRWGDRHDHGLLTPPCGCSIL